MKNYYPEDNILYFINDDNMIFVEPIFTPSFWQRIKHLFGNHFYTWDKKGCRYLNCEKQVEEMNLTEYKIGFMFGMLAGIILMGIVGAWMIVLDLI